MFMQNASHQSRNFHWGLVGKKSFDGTSEMCLDRLKGRGGGLKLMTGRDHIWKRGWSTKFPKLGQNVFLDAWNLLRWKALLSRDLTAWERGWLFFLPVKIILYSLFTLNKCRSIYCGAFGVSKAHFVHFLLNFNKSIPDFLRQLHV